MKVTMISLPLNPHHICEFLMETRVSLEAVKKPRERRQSRSDKASPH